MKHDRAIALIPKVQGSAKRSPEQKKEMLLSNISFFRIKFNAN
jgi:hypothetical protein